MFDFHTWEAEQDHLASLIPNETVQAPSQDTTEEPGTKRHVLRAVADPEQFNAYLQTLVN